MDMTITGIVYLDKPQQFLNPQLDENDQEGHIQFQQDGAPPCYLGEVHEYPNTSFPSRGLVEWRRWHGHLVPQVLYLWIFSYGDSLKIE
jgi:hypothetical protein